MTKIRQLKETHGFTLIELLIVIFIISIISGVALLSIGQNVSKKTETFANVVYQTLTLAQEQAILKTMVIGVLIRPQSLQYVKYELDTKTKKKRWLALDDKFLSKLAIPDGVFLRMQRSGVDIDTETPAIIVSTNGDLTPFVLSIGKQGEQPSFSIRGESDGSLVSKRL